MRGSLGKGAFEKNQERNREAEKSERSVVEAWSSIAIVFIRTAGHSRSQDEDADGRANAGTIP